jgi:lambda repressor-like predicted transcriptional regulator
MSSATGMDALFDLAPMAVAQAGAAGVCLADLQRLCGLSPETLADVLRGLVATGQVEMVEAGGEIRYRATT